MLALSLSLGACASTEKTPVMPAMEQQPEKLSQSAISGEFGPRALSGGKNVSTVRGELDGGLVLSDGKGGVVVIPGEKPQGKNSAYVDARELKLKIRELAEQLIAGIRDCSLQGVVALPTAFVNLDNFNETSSLGRLIAEQMFHEFTQRGFPIREYRLPATIRVHPGEGELYLSREIGNAAPSPRSAVIVGTYSGDRRALFINARLVKPDGQVLRTANLVLEGNALTGRLMRSSGGRSLAGGEMRIRDYEEATRPAGGAGAGGASPFDRGEDIH
jgi:hypothetical protein